MITAYIDGGARGNPGPAGYGAWIVDNNGETLAELHGALGVATNNVAEYRGLIAALTWAAETGCPALHIRADSLLLIQQMTGKYRVRHQGLIPLYEQARDLVARIGHVTFEHIPREQNRRADLLSNRGMDLNH